MLKKTMFLALLLSSSSLSFAKHLDSTLTVAPYHPSEWGYIAATATINNGSPNTVGTGVTLPVSLNNNISLIVFAMNSRPKLADSCQNIQIHDEGPHRLLFELKEDWLIHCRNS